MGETSIEWTDRSVNPVRARLKADPKKVGHYCELVSPGCLHCYSSGWQPRFGLPVFGGTHGRGLDLVEPFLDPDKLSEVLRRRIPTKWFWEDMSDLFGEWVPFEWIAACFGIMAATPWHTHQVLTKRPERAAEFLRWCEKRGNDGLSLFPEDPLDWRIRQLLNVSARREGVDMNPDARQNHGGPWPLPNVWFGVSVEDRKHGLPRIDQLRKIPAGVRFLSIEPLLEDLGEIDLSGISWVIVGGESGHGARPMHPAWVRSLRDQCVAAEVRFFFKQWGAWLPVESGAWIGRHSAKAGYTVPLVSHAWPGENWKSYRVGKGTAGQLLDGRKWSEMPEVVRG